MLYELFCGPMRPVYFSTIILVILLLMLVMTFRLFVNRRKKAYFSLSLSLLVVMAQHILIIAAGTDAPGAGNWAGYATILLKAVSFIFLNLGIYQMYNSSRTRQHILTWSAVTVAVLLSLMYFIVDGFEGNPGQVVLLQNLGIELYMFLMLFLCHQWISPWIGQWNRYQLSLSFYFIYQLIHLADVFITGSAYPALATAGSLFLVLYYITLFLIVFERVVELLQAVYTKSITDALTGLYNRLYFMNRLKQYLSHEVPVTVIFTDIDNFKRLNDTQGHDKGDEALKKVALILRECVEEIGVAGRLGGEEMVVLVTDPEAHPGELAELIRKRIEAEAGVTVSVGYSKAKRGISPDALVKQADEAMYQAKTSGKNKVCKYMKQKQLNAGGHAG